MSGEPGWEAVDEVKTEIEVIKRKCEQYWNERGIEDPEIHAILGFIHQRADGIARALAAAQAAVWEEAAKLAEEESLVPEDEKYDNEVAIQRGQGTYYNMAMTRIAKACRARATAARPAGGRP